MKENKVCSLELSKRLKELGIKQESEFVWVVHKRVNEENFKNCIVLLSNESSLLNFYPDEYWDRYSAFLSDELLEMLPDRIEKDGVEYEFYIIKDKRGYLVGYIEIYGDPKDVFSSYVDKSLPNALAKMLIYLFENNLIHNEQR